ncbi:MAG: OmpA family protein [Cyclobacteriaceae bacterium]|nr:OmpA family protein [Cyclobacteriaceae bacterium]
MKRNLILLSLLCWSVLVNATIKNSISNSETDSLVFYKGIIVDEFSGKLLEGVSVHYKKLPYQSEIGLLVTNETGEFKVYFRARESYSLQINKEGYISLSEVIHPLEGADNDLNRTDTIKLKGGVGSVLELHNLNFKQGNSKITSDSFEELNNLVNMLKDTPAMIIQLEGHTDFRGSPVKNLKLSENRVQALKDFLVSNGIDKSRVLTKAFGGSQPITQENTPEARAQNRRVEVRIISE